MPSLAELIEAAGITAQIDGDSTMAIRNISDDSRKVTGGTLFAAIEGTARDGAAFIPQAIQSGAAAILLRSGKKEHWDTEHTARVEVDQERLALAKLSAAFTPRQPEKLVGITGTNGKTSTAEFYRQLGGLLGHSAASLGTLGLISPYEAIDAQYPSGQTSPAPILLHETLDALAGAGLEMIAIEASSHGLDQYRLDGVRFSAVCFTNLSRDHLDYHPTMEAYFAAKARLFTELGVDAGQAVIYADDPHSDALIRACEDQHYHRILTYGTKGKDLQIKQLEPNQEGIFLRATILGSAYEQQLPLYGSFQVHNLLAAVGLCVCSGFEISQLLGYLPHMKGVRGRMEKVATHPLGAPVFVDYAHTPDALTQLLNSLRPHTEGKLHLVFGCGGDRDRGKRSVMGEIADKLADAVIVTDDNPRTEDPASIRAAILSACPAAREIGDRREAIHAAVKALDSKDVLVIAGKGHETTQIIGAQQLECNDAAIAREACDA